MANFILTASPNVFIGTAGGDTFNATLATFGPDDFLFGGGGSDTLLVGGLATGILVLEEDQFQGFEIVTVTGTAAIGINAAGVDNALSITGNTGANAITGTNAADMLSGGAGNDTLNGGTGNDTLNGGAGLDSIVGGTGDDVILVGVATDLPLTEVINGGSGEDTLRVTAASGLVTLGAGIVAVERVQIAGAGAVGVNAANVGSALRIEGNSGANAITGTAQGDTVTGSGGNDVLSGGGGDDVLVGGTGNDNLSGDAGIDLFQYDSLAEYGLDTVNGGASFDILFFNDTIAGGTLTLAAGSRTTGLEAVAISDGNFNTDGTTALNVDASAVAGNLVLAGNAGANTLIGTMGNNEISGHLGDDVLIGLSGNDSLAGEAGADTVTAGAGADTLTGGAGADVLRGGMGDDLIELNPGDYAAGEVIDGGSGNGDTMLLLGAGDTLDLTAIPDTAIRNIEIIDLGFAGGNSLRLNAADVLAINASGTLRVNGFSDHFVQADGPWEQGADTVIGGQTYAQYTSGDATLQVGIDVAFSGGGDIQLASLNSLNGFRLPGVAAGDLSGRSVSAAGDVNGDGFDDLIIGAYFANPNGDNSGASYVVFGGAGSFGADFNLSGLNGVNGFRISGVTAGDRSGVSVSDAGDVNGDGFDDLIVGADSVNAGAPYSGASYLVFGKAGGFGANLELSGLNGINGFRISGVALADSSGNSVSAAGDFNGDGFGDFIIGGVGADPNGDYSGASYLVFGRAGGFAANLNLSALNGVNGFKISGVASDDYTGFSVSGAGDVNGDGFSDVVIGAYGAPGGNLTGASYVVFGAAGGFAANLQLSAINGTNGFKISGEAPGDRAGRSVSSAGDVNRDGFDDILIGATRADGNAGASYVVFGHAGAFGANVNLSGLNGTNGFRISGVASDDYSGYSVSSAGDVNGDGFGDLIVGAPGADPIVSSSGASYVVFGQAGGFTANVDLSALDGSTGFMIAGVASLDAAGGAVSAAGDVNGDGFDDLLIAARQADPNGSYSGASYVVFGGDFTGAVHFVGGSGNDSIAGDFAAEVLIGGLGDDTLDGGGGGDVLKGGAGDDVFFYDFFARIEGGSGSDTLVARDGTVSLDLRASAETRVTGIEVIDLTGTESNTVTLDAAGLVAMTEGSHFLRVMGDAGTTLSAGSGWLYTGNVASGGESYAQYTQGAATLQVDTDIRRTIGFDIDLATLAGGRGFQITGEIEDAYTGNSVSSAGDVNGDGFDDLIIGARRYYSDTGTAYVVFGKGGGFTDFNLDSLTPSDGFQITAEAPGDRVGFSVSSAGDVNGDGFSDLFVGARDNGANGAAYVVFGKSGDFADISLAALGSDGYKITGEGIGDDAGRSVAEAGDVNGDGFADIIVGAYKYDALNRGSAWVVFGKGAGFTDISLADIGMSPGVEDGFQMAGAGTGNEYAGISVSSAGDVNGDGFDDVLVGAPFVGATDTGAAYVVFGNSSVATVSLGSLGSAGFTIIGEAAGDYAGISVSTAGDVNGDGFSDIVVGANGVGSQVGGAHVVFGKSGGFTDINLASVTNGTHGFQITGEASGDQAGMSVSSAGDVNGDGFDDIVIGSFGFGGFYSAAYVIFGKAEGFTDINLATLGTAGFQITGEAFADFAGEVVSAAGDVNGDGFDDILIGAAGHGGTANNGAAYVVFGGDFSGAVTFEGGSGNESFTGTVDAESLIGGLGNDTLIGGAGADVLKGGGGDDVLVHDASDFRVDGGGGEDTLLFTGSGTFSLAGRYTGIEVVDLTGSGNNILHLQTRDVLDLSDSTHILRVDGNAGDRVVSTGQGWVLNSTQTIDGVLYQSYTDGAATLLIDTAVTQQIS